MHKKSMIVRLASLAILVILNVSSITLIQSIYTNEIKTEKIYTSDHITSLHFSFVNHPPSKPIQPTPFNNSKNISLNPLLSVRVIDPDNDKMTVFFYNASNHHIIGVAQNVYNNTIASVYWLNLSYNTTYHWYVVVNDSKTQTFSDTFTFTTANKIHLKIILDHSTRGITVTVKNNDPYDYNNIKWSIHIISKRQRIKTLNISDQGVINIKAKKDCIIMKSISGFGRININISLSVMNQTIYTKVNALIIRYKVIVYSWFIL
ncbi:MAG: hypothetical protein QXS02_03765 [Candidatus Thermoplasmatota archaeon]